MRRYDPENRETTYLPSGEERLAQRFRYDENDNVTHETDALGHTVSHTFDAAGFEIGRCDANGHASATSYDSRGNVSRFIDAEGRATTCAWSSHGKLDLVIDGEGKIRRYENDVRGNTLSATDAEGHSTRFIRDDRGRLLHTVFPDGAEESRNGLPPIVGTHYLWDGATVAEEAMLRLDGSVDWSKSTRWHFEPDGFRPLAKEVPQGGLNPIVSDHLGTPREMFDEQGNMRWAATFTTWGVLQRAILSASSNDNIDPKADDCPVRFQGQWSDEETGLCYNFHRHYDPFSAQYTTSDPIGLAAAAHGRTHIAIRRMFKSIRSAYGLRLPRRSRRRGECCSGEI